MGVPRNWQFLAVIAVSAFVLAGSVAFTFRWEGIPSGNGAIVFRLDRWSGRVERCIGTNASNIYEVLCGNR